ncbi:14.7 kDa ribonuclease H-like protein [Solanum tuberosum]|uniref:14.7 kDa ribonuclease H-like protein n=1 Tax=Solanum tuberosum TaxID=4113 RepID=UPI00073A4198|nr:PREDICTED: 14.7 kDa ribonuclease H-like protein [Solanum tuberosum]
MWELWKSRNARRHGKDVSYYMLQQKCQDTVYKLIKHLYPWIQIPRNWEGMFGAMKEYKPKLHYHSVFWGLPQEGGVKCNTDGASRGNPGESAYSFCVRNHEGNLMYAEACKIGIRNNIEAETVAILKALRYCKIKKINKVLIETDSLVVTKMIRNEWKIPWNQVEEIEEIQEIIENIQADITHVFREANQLVDKLVNEAYT